jgi:hypothetical protein
MTAAQPNTDKTVAQTMLQSIVEAICDRPGDTTAQRDARSRDVVDAILGFRPRDPVEMMLAGMAVTHVHLVYDTARDVLRGQDELLRARSRSTIVALDRGMIGFLRELRIARSRTIEGWTGVEQSGTEATEAPAKPQLAKPQLAKPQLAKPQLAKSQPDPVKPDAPPVPKVPGSSSPRMTMPEPPVPLLPASQSTDTSIAAMMTVQAPPAMTYIVPPAVVRPPGAVSVRSDTRPSGSQAGAGMITASDPKDRGAAAVPETVRPAAAG